MKHFLPITSLFLAVATTGIAQKQAEQWYFGHNAGIDFTSGTATVVTNGALYAEEGSASMSTASGTLLFYTDGITVYNKNHVAMPNGTGLNGGASSTQPAIIVPLPGSTHEFYIFTLDEYGSPDGLNYSIVDMLLDGGNGDVTTKNFFVEDSLTEKMAVVKEVGGNDFWIVVHKWGNDAFYAYPLNALGLQAPVISHVGMVHPTTMIQYTYGQMKFTGCGDRLALANGYLDAFELFDFSTATGVVSNPITISVPDHVYGIEFSPNENYIYLSTYENGGSLVQYDITSGIPATIITSAFTLFVSSGPQIYGMQLATDGKIYVVSSYSPFLGVINDPNIASIGANYVDMGLNLDPGGTGLISNGLSLPSFVSTYVNLNKVCTVGEEEIFSEADMHAAYPNPSVSAFTFVPNIPRACVKVYDQYGNMVEQFNNAANNNFTFGQNYAPGVYMIVEQNEEVTVKQKLVKQ